MCALLVLVSATLRADVTITQTVTVEGGAVAMMGQSLNPRLVLRIKGTKARTDVDASGRTMITIADLATGQVTTLNAADKTARVVDPPSAATAGAAASGEPKVDFTMKPTGQTRTIAGVACDEYALAMTMSLST